MCDRCGVNPTSTIMSMFNTDTLCPPCKEDERALPSYSAAAHEEERQLRFGNYNFAGVGLNEQEKVFLAARLEARARGSDREEP